MPPTRKATIIALANQKGGVAKTTSVASLGAAFAEAGRRVLLVDLDPQASLTFSLGIDPDTVEASVHDVLVGGTDLVGRHPCLRRRRRPRAQLHRAGRLRGRAPRPPGPRVRPQGGLGAGAPALRRHPPRLQSEPRGADAQRPHRGPGARRADAVRDAQPPRRRPAARHGRRRQADPQQEAADPRDPAHPLRRAEHARPRGPRGRRPALRRAGPRAAHPPDRALRRGPRGGPLDPHHRALEQGREGLP